MDRQERYHPASLYCGIGPYDYIFRGNINRGNSNWVFNAAYASSLELDASVRRFDLLGQVERCVAVGVPLVASQLAREASSRSAAIPKSDSYLLSIRGFDSSGNIIVNNPAGCDEPRVRRVYRRGEFAWAWFCSGPGRNAYLVCPEGSAPSRS